jgi:tetratricopeptide (TPR) repeat protein
VIEKFIGDAVMAVFGLSVAREDDPENAILAALEMRQDLAVMNQELRSSREISLTMRTGIHTGLAMIAILGDRQARKEGQGFVAVGDTVNLASRLQGAAPEGGILITNDTYRLVRGIFEIQEQGPIQVKGKKDPVRVYLVLDAKQRAFYSPARGVEGIETRMVGRDVEFKQMKDALSMASEQRKTQVIVITGEAGIGKSRLVSEFDNWLEIMPEVVRYFRCRASPSMENTPYSLFRDMFLFRFQIQDSDSPRIVQEKIEKGLDEFRHPDNQRRALFIGDLLGFRLPGSPTLAGAKHDPSAFLDTTLTYLTDYLRDVAKIRTVVIILEDVHWGDESSLGLLDQLISRLPDQPILLVCTARRSLFERYPEWGEDMRWGGVRPKLLHLTPLTQQESQGLIEEILQKVDLIPESLHSLIVNSAEGNPFFMEEFIKMLIEDGIILKEDEHWRIDLTKLENVAIPATLVEVLQARFDALSLEERVLLQRASVVGRTFWDDAVGSMESASEDQVKLFPTMESTLRNLSTREMIYHVRNSTFAVTNEFIFKHALLRDVIYESVLKRMRKVYHAYAAAWLESVTESNGRSDEYAVLIAEHFENAENLQKARHWYLNAGTRAAERYANAEGIRCFSRSLELTPEEDLAARYDVLMKRVELYNIVADRESQKYDLEVLQAIAEQIDLNTSGVKAQRKFPHKSYRAEVCLQWWHYHDALSEYPASTKRAEQAIDLARAALDLETEATGYLFLGATFWKRAEFAAAEAPIKRSLSLAQQAHARKQEGDALRNLGIVLQYQQRFPQAQKHYEAALSTYHEIGDEKGESMVLNSLGILLTDQGRLHEARRYYERSLEIKRKTANRRAINTTLNNLGFVAIKMGRYSEAVKLFNEELTYSLEVGELEAQADTYNALGMIDTHLGRYSTAREQLERAIFTHRRYESKYGICQTILAQALLESHIGNLPTALSLSQEAFALAQELDLKYEEACAITYAGVALLNMNELEQAIDRLQEGLERWVELDKLNMLTEANYVRAALARNYLEGGEREKAIELVEELLASLVGQPVTTAKLIRDLPFSALEGIEEPFEMLLNAHIVLETAADMRADALLDATYRLLLEQASWIEEESLRDSFLENIQTHKDIIAKKKQIPG